MCVLLSIVNNGTLQLKSAQESNARIMNKGTDQNIMTQLGITSNEYNLVTVLYYVRKALALFEPRCHALLLMVDSPGPIHCTRGALKSFTEKIFAFKMAVKNHDHLGNYSDVQCGCQEQRWLVYHTFLAGRGMFPPRRSP